MFRKKNLKWLIVATVVASVLTVGATVVMAQTGEDTATPRAGTLVTRMPRGEGWGENDTYLADALGITPDELAAAQQTAEEVRVAQAVLDGKITQEQADAMAAHNALKDYLNPGKLIADKLGVSVEELRDQMTEMRASAIQQAVEDGVITQEQADSVPNGEGPGFFGPRGFEGRGGSHGHGPGDLGGFRGHHLPRVPEVDSEND